MFITHDRFLSLHEIRHVHRTLLLITISGQNIGSVKEPKLYANFWISRFYVKLTLGTFFWILKRFTGVTIVSVYRQIVSKVPQESALIRKRPYLVTSYPKIVANITLLLDCSQKPKKNQYKQWIYVPLRLLTYGY